MNRIFLPISALTLLFAGLLSVPAGAQSAGSFPYNPDANDNGLVESADLIEFLSFYGAAFQASGVLPVDGGGTGVSTVDSAKVVLGVSTYADLTPAGQVGPTGQITGSLNITQRLAQGFGTDASGAYAQAQGRNTTASGTYSFACNQNSTATATCSSAIGEGSTARRSQHTLRDLAPMRAALPPTLKGTIPMPQATTPTLKGTALTH